MTWRTEVNRKSPGQLDKEYLALSLILALPSHMPLTWHRASDHSRRIHSLTGNRSLSSSEETYESGNEIIFLTVALELRPCWPLTPPSLCSSLISLSSVSWMDQVSYTHRAFAYVLSVFSSGFRYIVISLRKHSWTSLHSEGPPIRCL